MKTLLFGHIIVLRLFFLYIDSSPLLLQGLKKSDTYAFAVLEDISIKMHFFFFFNLDLYVSVEAKSPLQ